METVKSSVVTGRWKEWSVVNRQNAEDFQSSENNLSDIIIIDICHHTFVHTTPGVNLKVNYGLGVIIVSVQFILDNNHSTLVSDADHGEARHVGVGVGREYMGNLCIFLIFCCKCKTALFKKSLLKQMSDEKKE